MGCDITGIRRSVEFSPNHVDNDWMILKLTAERLGSHGYSVQLVDEDDVDSIKLNSPVIFNMCQGARANCMLREVESEGRLIINPPKAVLNCHRHNLVSILQRAAIPFPKSFIVDTRQTTNIPDAALMLEKLWIKRGDVHATGPGDVVLVEGHEKIRRILEGFRDRGIDKAILQEHIEGPTIKFYAVQHDDFFRWYPLKSDANIHVNARELYELAEASAEALGLHIYGGDGILKPDGKFILIDMNDWPSYARFREVAANYIADHIVRKAKEYGKL